MTNLGVTGAWTYHARLELKKRGFRWDGSRWNAPSLEARNLAVTELSGAAPTEKTITIHADAGWKEGVGRCAWLIRSSVPPFKVEGVYTGGCADVVSAEARALLKGVQDALRAFTPEEGTLFYLRTDNTSCVKQISSGSAKTPEIAELLALLRGYKINVKHVPAHGKASGTAAWANDRVDALSHLRGDEGRKRMRDLTQEAP